LQCNFYHFVLFQMLMLISSRSICCASSLDVLEDKESTVPITRISFGIATGAILLCMAFLQLLHQGSGTGARWLRKEIRLIVQVLAGFLCMGLGFVPQLADEGLVGVIAGVVCAMAVVALLGRKRKPLSQPQLQEEGSPLISSHAMPE
jgi:hypothetical protein